MKKENYYSFFNVIKNSIIYFKSVTKKDTYKVFLTSQLIIAISSCTTTQMTISPRAFGSTIEKIKSEISSVGKGYQLTGSGSDTKNEIKVTGQSYSKYSGYGTLMDNETSIYSNYTFTDSIGNTVEFQIKHKNANDYSRNEYIYNVEVIKCSCGDKKLFSVVCGDNGIVKQVTQIAPDQQSNIYDPGATYLTIFGVSLGVSLIALLPLLAL